MTDTAANLFCLNVPSQLLFESSADCVKVLDAEGRLLQMNRNGQCLMEIDDASAFQGLSWATLWPEENRELVFFEMDKARNGIAGRFSAYCPTAKGTPKFWNVCITPIYEANGKLHGLLAVSRDITSLQQTTSALKQSIAELNLLKLEREHANAFTVGQKKALEQAVTNAPIETVLSTLVETAEAYAGNTVLASILLMDETGKHLRLGAAPSFPDSYNQAIDGMLIGPAAGSCGTAAFTKRSVFVRDIKTDPLWADFGELATSHGLRSCWSQPILSSKGKVLGTFAFYYLEARDPASLEEESMPVLLHTAALVLEGHQEAREREAADRALRRSEANFKRFIDSNIIGILQYKMDGSIKQANDAFLTMLGYTREEFEQGEKSWKDLTPAEWADANRKAVDQLQTTGTVENFQKEFLRKDGSRVSVYMGAANFENSHDEGIAYVLDISGIKKATQALKDSEDKFRTIANAMPQMIWSTLPDGFHDYYNDQWYKFTGVPYGSTDGEGWNGMFHPDDQELAWKVWQHSLTTGEPYEIEYRLRHHSGQYRWTLGRALPIRDENGQIVRWMGTCTDIHEQRLTQEALKDSDKRKDEFLAMLAHELRNPLAPISAAADLMRATRLDEDRIRQMSGVIARQAHHMTGLIEDLLDVSRVTRGLITLDKTTLDVREIIAEAIEQVRPSADAYAHYLEVNMPGEGIQIAGDRKRLVQVLANLLNNAVKFTPNNGHIILRTKTGKDKVVISIRDNGIGMSADLAERAFELFVQGERSSDRAQGGLGIGLALVKSLVILHGGTIAAHSLGKGMGSEFTFCLPTVVAQKKTLHADDRISSVETAGEGLCILVVDDNVDAGQILGMFLELAGHNVYLEQNPTRALECVRAIAPDVCLLDIGLPEMNGNELTQRLKQLPEMEGVTMIAISGYGQLQDREAALAAGFDHYFVKPVDTAKLMAMLADISAQKR